MNKEGISSNDNLNTETLEKQEQPPVTLETKESGQEFANKILNKIKEYMSSFTSKKEAMEKIESTVSFDDPTIKEQIKSEINLDNQLDEIDNEAQIIQTEASENINLITRDFSKAYHHPEYRNEVAKKIIEARNSGQDAETVRSEFYNKTASEKENFESQEKERSVAEIMKEKDMIIVHGIPFLQKDFKNVKNNKVINSNQISFEDSCEIITGLEPTLSTSIPSPDRENNGLYYPAGVILGEGKILSAKAGDSASVAFDLHKRIPKYGNEEHSHSAIEPNINVDNIVPASKDTFRGTEWNELTVEHPKIAGLFYDLSWGEESYDPNDKRYEWVGDNESREKEANGRKEDFLENQQNRLVEMRKYSEKMDLPLYVLKNENGKINKYSVEFIEHPEYTKDYLKKVIIPKGDALITKNEYGIENYTPEYEKFFKEECTPVINYVNLGIREYKLHPVSAEDIYKSKRDISDQEKNKMIEDIKNKGILSVSAEKEVDKKFQKEISLGFANHSPAI